MRILHVFLEACRCVLHEPVLCQPAKMVLPEFGVKAYPLP